VMVGFGIAEPSKPTNSVGSALFLKPPNRFMILAALVFSAALVISAAWVTWERKGSELMIAEVERRDDLTCSAAEVMSTATLVAPVAICVPTETAPDAIWVSYRAKGRTVS
jgi:hypothetical protein